MIPTLTKRESILLTIKMWEVLASHDYDSKSEAFDCLKVPKDDRPLYGCYCCEYVKQQGGFAVDPKYGFAKLNCTLCPVWGHDKCCEDIGEAYQCWASAPYRCCEDNGEESGYDYLREQAQAIVNLAKEKLREIDA